MVFKLSQGGGELGKGQSESGAPRAARGQGSLRLRAKKAERRPVGLRTSQRVSSVSEFFRERL